MELETSDLLVRDVWLGGQDCCQGRDVSCMGYRLLSKAAFELGSVLSWDNWTLDLGQLWKMRM